MTDPIMLAGSVLFAILFGFLLVIFFTTLASFFRKDDYPDFQPLISIIIPCYNEEKNIVETLDYVYALDYPHENIEVIVVDDGSTDHTLSLIRSYPQKNLRILKGNHEGKTASLNLGVKHSHHDIILCMDADTIIQKDSLKKLVRPLALDDVGATNGSCIAKNSDSLISIFHNI